MSKRPKWEFFEPQKFKKLLYEADQTDLSGLHSLTDISQHYGERNRHHYYALVFVCDIEEITRIAPHVNVTICTVVDKKYYCLASGSKESWIKLGYMK